MDAETRQYAVTVVRAEETIRNLIEFLEENSDRIYLLDKSKVDQLRNLLAEKAK